MELKPLDLFPLKVESSIYGMTSVDDKILVTTSDCKVFCIEFNKLKPHIREIEFAYIPNGAKIISISALKRDENDFVIGIAHCKNNSYYFNVYTGGLGDQNSPKYRDRCVFDLEHLAQGCQTIRLRYVPYHLLSTNITARHRVDRTMAVNSPCWLMSGSDNRIHIFTEDLESHNFEERPVGAHFPELDVTFDCPALWTDVVFTGQPQKQRAIAVAFENGSVRLFLSQYMVETGKYNLVQNLIFNEYSTIVPCVRLFQVGSQISKCNKLISLKKTPSDTKQESESDATKTLKDSINLLVVSSTHPCLIFEDIIEQGLSLRQELPNSQRIDCNTTAAFGDINFDGLNEILIGNHGKELLTYKYDISQKQFQLDHVQLFNNPIYSISTLDITKDVLQEVSLLLSDGVLLLQSPVSEAIEICKQRVDSLVSRINRKSNT